MQYPSVAVCASTRHRPDRPPACVSGRRSGADVGCTVSPPLLRAEGLKPATRGSPARPPDGVEWQARRVGADRHI